MGTKYCAKSKILTCNHCRQHAIHNGTLVLVHAEILGGEALLGRALHSGTWDAIRVLQSPTNLACSVGRSLLITVVLAESSMIFPTVHSCVPYQAPGSG